MEREGPKISINGWQHLWMAHVNVLDWLHNLIYINTWTLLHTFSGWSTNRNIFMIGICMSQYVCLCNISLMLLLWIVLQNAYLEQKKKVISVYSTIYCICMLCYACHTRLIYNKLRKVCFWQCFKFLLFAFCHRSLAESSFIIIHFALTLEKFLVLYFWKLDITTNK